MSEDAYLLLQRTLIGIREGISSISLCKRGGKRPLSERYYGLPWCLHRCPFISYIVPSSLVLYRRMMRMRLWSTNGSPLASSSISAINLTQFEFEPGAPKPYNTSWPSQWPGSAQLQQSLESVQQDPSSWTNLSNPDCRIKYGLRLTQHIGLLY